MSTPHPASPLDDAERLAAALREQGLPEDELPATAAALAALAQWPAPAPTAADTRRLVALLTPLVPSPVRSAARARQPGLAGELGRMLRLARAQVSLLTPAFWLASLVVVLLGAALGWAAPSASRVFVLRVIGPLLAYLGTASAFRASGLKMLEFELACPPSPRQLTLARLTVVLSYDLALGLALSLLLWPHSGAGFWPLTLHWLAPLLLGTGLTLLLSLRLPIGPAAALAYAGWLAGLALSLISASGAGSAASSSAPGLEAALGAAGLALIAAMLLALPRAVEGLLPRGGRN